MELVIKGLAHKHGLDIAALDDGLTLKIPDSARLPLMISKMSRQCISVAHFFLRNDDVVFELDMHFCTNVAEGQGWLPIYIAHPTLGLHKEFGVLLSWDEWEVEWHDYPGRQKAIDFADRWAQNIRDAGYLSRGLRTTVAESYDQNF